MGIFSRKTIVTVSAQHIRMLEPKDDMNRQAVLAAVLTRSPIAESIIQAQMHGMYAMAERYYYYGKTQFTNGLPQGTAGHVMVSDMRIISALRKEFPDLDEIVIQDASVDVANPDVFIRSVLRDKYAYNNETGQVATPPAGITGDVELVGIRSIEEDQIGLLFASTTIQDEVEVIETVSGFNPSKSYLQVVFTALETDTGTGETTEKEFEWTYEIGSGVYSELEDSNGVPDSNPYYPIVPIRLDNKDMSGQSGTDREKRIVRDTDLFKTSKIMLKKLTLDIESIGTSINNNENVVNIDNVFFGVKVDIRDDTPIVTEYLGRYFYSLHQANGNTKDLFDTWKEGTKGRTPPSVNIVIQEGLFKQSINYLYTETDLEDGTLEAPEVTFKILDRAPVVKLLGISLFEYEQSYVTYRYQESKGKIRTITVHGLMTVDFIYRTETIDINLKDSAVKADGDDSSKMMIPIHRGVVRNMRLPERNKLFHSAMYLTVQTHDKRKQKWYETSLFKWIVIIIAVVITVLTGGTGVAAIGLALGTGLAVSIIIYITLMLVIGEVMKFLAEAVISIFGPEVGKWLAVIMVVVAIYFSGDVDSGMAALTGMFSTALTTAYVEEIESIISDIADAIAFLAAETAAFSEKISKIMEEILGDRLIVNIPAILKDARRYVPIYLAQESAEQYYARIEGSTHINEIMLSLPSIYNSKSLVPPTLDEALEQFKKG
tara:strand:- start:15141 stop:17288 length:2148 start_codon:yes stop_codon:yes gene_type:complete